MGTNSTSECQPHVRENVEVECGKRADRPVLQEAIRECKAKGYTLLVAKFDRLSRNLHFVTTLQNSKVDFVAADNPHATPFLIHILVAVAEHERNLISSRTKAALQAAKRRGKKLGDPRYEEAVPKAVAARKKLADRNRELRRIIQETMDRTGLTTLTDIARALNLRRIKTNRGCEFTPTQIHRLLRAA
jgi:DNA invertase Pin-like site-specific DNA recombinase